MAESIGSEARPPGFKSCIYYFIAVGFWGHVIKILRPSLPIWKLDRTIVSTLIGLLGGTITYKALETVGNVLKELNK